jgi:heme/copper-type cytochrome/quinol oxidase subunit 1
MSNITNKPHLIFWISIPIIILFGIVNRNDMLYINVHDTYFVFSKTDLAIMLSILFAIIGLGYWMLLKASGKLSKLLNLIHMTLTFGGILLIWVLAQLFRKSIINYDFNENLTLAIYIISLIAILGQIIYPLNIIRGLINRPTKTYGE